MVLSRRVRQVAALGAIVAAMTLGGCGRRGKLEPPPDPSNPFALGTDQPGAEGGAAQPGAKTRVGTHRRPKNPPIRAPNEPFILDPLL